LGPNLATSRAEVNMGNSGIRLWLVLVLAMATAGCELAVDIFQAGLWVGVIMVALTVGLVLWLVGKVRG
jgi:energy-converting hydrogenase Eha subunit H